MSLVAFVKKCCAWGLLPNNGVATTDTVDLSALPMGIPMSSWEWT